MIFYVAVAESWQYKQLTRIVRVPKSLSMRRASLIAACISVGALSTTALSQQPPPARPLTLQIIDSATSEPLIGAEISGVNLADPLSNSVHDEIHRAFAENLVIFFRDQHITPQQHLAFGRKFGELHIHPAAPHEGDDPALMKIYADKDSPRGKPAERFLREWYRRG